MYRNVVYDVGGRAAQIHYLSDPEKLSFLVEALQTPHRAIEVYVEVGILPERAEIQQVISLHALTNAFAAQDRVVRFRYHGVCDALWREYRDAVRRYLGDPELNVGEVLERLEADCVEMTQLVVEEERRVQWRLELARLAWARDVTRARLARLGARASNIYLLDSFVSDWVATIHAATADRYDVLFMMHHASVVPELQTSRLVDRLVAASLDAWELAYTCIDALVPRPSSLIVIRDPAVVQRMHQWLGEIGIAPRAPERDAPPPRDVPDRFTSPHGCILFRGVPSLMYQLANHSPPDRLPDPIDEFYRVCPPGY